ncbi:MAG TPA: sortase [Patescibacteria group bacterium]|nr:sortase [Patescibacteria group bacterium]
MLSKNILFKLIIAVYIGAAVFALTNPSLQWTKPQPTTISTISNSPTDIKISKINLDLAISPAILKGNEWQLFDDRVAWLSSSALPGKGNTIMYAHDRVGLFANLKNLKPGDEIDIYTNKWIIYKVTQVHAVLPTDVNAVLGTQNRLTLYTCDGSFDQKRLVVYAE